MFMLYVIIHSIIGLQIYPGYAQLCWWIWGPVATIATVLLAVGSGLYVRVAQYELFLISHVMFSVFVVGCWYHLWGWYGTSVRIVFAPFWLSFAPETCILLPKCSRCSQSPDIPYWTVS